MSSPQDNPLASLPSVDVVLQHLAAQPAGNGIPRPLLADCVRQAIQSRRAFLATASQDPATPVPADRETLIREIAGEARRLAGTLIEPHYRQAINATGIILHTGLGRAVLPEPALARVGEQLAGYSVLQVDATSGKRSRRDARIEWLVHKLTGAEAATVVNNNAAATMIVLNSVAQGREVIVSRGQLVELGGSFRLPDVMAMSGAKLVEVGTTNKTHARDYERAITENTAAILRVHPSNYHIEGFTAEVPLAEMVEIAHTHGLPLIDDVGAGALIDYRRIGLPEAPTLPDSVRAGADLILSSTDKMIGGPQGGLILGKAAMIEAIRKNPLARALRVDKITLSLLESTLSLFLDEEIALREIPTLRMIRRSPAELCEQAQRIAAAIRARVPQARIDVVDGFSQVGSGSLPGHQLPTTLVVVAPPAAPDAAAGCGSNAPRPAVTAPESVENLARRLREGSPPVFARIADNRILLDPRTLLPGEETALVGALVEALARCVA